MSSPSPQASSLFFQRLPPEIRLDIYSHLFCSTRLSFGRRLILVKGERIRVRKRPAPNSLSILRVCRRVNGEIGDSWLGQVLFNFYGPVTLLDKLADLDRETLGKLRHMRFTCDNPLALDKYVLENGQCYWLLYRLPEILKILPGLHLDRLIVAGVPTSQEKYFILDALINHSDGWKELYFLANNSVMLGFGKFDKLWGDQEWNRPGWRAPQPSTWAKALAARDGPTASVTIFRSADPDLSGSMLSKPATCGAFTDQIAEPGKESEYGVEQDPDLMMPGEKEKEILVVAKRGKGVDYTETGTSPMMEHDIRKHWPNMTWGQIRYMGIGWHEERLGRYSDDDDDDEDEDGIFEDLNPSMLSASDRSLQTPLHGDDRPSSTDGVAGTEVDERGCPIQYDTYGHVDDYEWGPNHTHFSTDYPYPT